MSSPFEFIMLLCFGASWPFSVYKTWKMKSCKGKSLVFLWLVLIGYASGIIHKILHSQDWVIFMYFLNGMLVLADMILCYRYQGREATPVDMPEQVAAGK